VHCNVIIDSDRFLYTQPLSYLQCACFHHAQWTWAYTQCMRNTPNEKHAVSVLIWHMIDGMEPECLQQHLARNIICLHRKTNGSLSTCVNTRHHCLTATDNAWQLRAITADIKYKNNWKFLIFSGHCTPILSMSKNRIAHVRICSCRNR